MREERVCTNKTDQLRVDLLMATPVIENQSRWPEKPKAPQHLSVFRCVLRHINAQQFPVGELAHHSHVGKGKSLQFLATDTPVSVEIHHDRLAVCRLECPVEFGGRLYRFKTRCTGRLSRCPPHNTAQRLKNVKVPRRYADQFGNCRDQQQYANCFAHAKHAVGVRRQRVEGTQHHGASG